MKQNAEIKKRENGEEKNPTFRKCLAFVIHVRASQHASLSWRSDPSPAFGLEIFYIYIVVLYHSLLDRKRMKVLSECEPAQSHELSEARRRCCLVPAEDLALMMRNNSKTD